MSWKLGVKDGTEGSLHAYYLLLTSTVIHRRLDILNRRIEAHSDVLISTPALDHYRIRPSVWLELDWAVVRIYRKDPHDSWIHLHIDH